MQRRRATRPRASPCVRPRRRRRWCHQSRSHRQSPGLVLHIFQHDCSHHSPLCPFSSSVPLSSLSSSFRIASPVGPPCESLLSVTQLSLVSVSLSSRQRQTSCRYNMIATLQSAGAGVSGCDGHDVGVSGPDAGVRAMARASAAVTALTRASVALTRASASLARASAAVTRRGAASQTTTTTTKRR